MSLIDAALSRQVTTWRWLRVNNASLAQMYSTLPVGTPESRQRHAQEHMWLERVTGHAATFALDPVIGDATYAASVQLPDLVALRPEDVVEPEGFVWCSRPLRIPPYVADSSRGELEVADFPASGFGWKVFHDARSGKEDHISGVFLLFVGDAEDYARRAGLPWEDFRARGVAMMQYSMFWRFGDTLVDMRARSDRNHETYGLDDDFVTDDDALVRAKFAYAFWHFCGERIFTRTREYAPRHVQRQASRMRWPGTPVVDVVTLRKREQDRESSTSEEARDWSCRWLVRGHWRRQWYPSLGAHKTIWIDPFVKGPDDRPFKLPGKRAYAVVR